MYKCFFKRLIDFLIVFNVLLVIWPILLIITIWLHFANKGAGAFFFQERPGKDGKIFKVIKFKSMTDERDADGNLLPNELRITPIGAFIRKTSIDELPQLINVLYNPQNQKSRFQKRKIKKNGKRFVDSLYSLIDLKTI